MIQDNHQQQMLIQEKKDYNITLNIMAKIFQQYGANISMTPMPLYHPYDANMTVTTKNKTKEYAVEIKERNYVGELKTLPLKVKKYCNIMSNVGNKTPIVIYLCNGKEYYIFDLNKLDLNKLIIKNWNIPKVQLTNNHQFEEQPTFFIPISMSIYRGTYANN